MRTSSQNQYPAGARRFPMGFWNYVSVEHQGVPDVADWADAGMTLTMSPEYKPTPEHTRKVKALLDAAAARDIRMILCDSRSYWRTLVSVGEDHYRRDMSAALAEFGQHPAVVGFHVGDEPDAANYEPACRAMRIQKEMAPRLSPFLNLFPWCEGTEKAVGFTDWAAYLDAYIKEARPDFLCYDCYSQMNPGTEGWEMYFKNLRYYLEGGRRHRLDYWTTLLSVGHFRYRPPREDDIRWQVSTALAHGARGLLWFFVYMRQPHDNYRVAPIDEHGERTETFQWLSRVNRSFLKGPAATLRDLTLQRVSHVGQAWGGFPLFDGSGLVSEVKSGHGTPLIISEFKDSTGRDYVMVVNNSQTDSTQARLRIRGRQPRLYRVGWMAKETPCAGGDGWKASRGDDFVRVQPWLAPGQLELYRVENAGA